MSLQQTLIDKLRNRGDLVFSETPHGVSIVPLSADGFSVEIECLPDTTPEECTILLGNGGFHWHFEEAEEALGFIAWCFSGEARIRELWRGEAIDRVHLGSFQDGSWQVVNT